jgi:hypothetical protein
MDGGGHANRELCHHTHTGHSNGQEAKLIVNSATTHTQAIATGNPSGDEYYTEPLDPANTDRFVVRCPFFRQEFPLEGH